MPAMVLSQVVGLLAKIFIASAFGTGPESEAFYAANRFTDILFNLMAGGALGSAFIPTFTGLLLEQDHSKAWKLASAIANLLIAVLTGVSILAGIFAPWVVRTILAPGFTGDPAREALTIDLLRIQLAAPTIFGLSGLVMGILNAHQSFLFPALAPSMYSLGLIFGVRVLAPHLGIYGLAYGVVAGAALHLLVQIPVLFRLPERRYFPILGLDQPSVREVGRLMAPRLIGVAVVQLNFLLNTYLASFQPLGSLTGVTYGFTIMYMPEAAIAQAIAIAALPTFSAQVARGKLDEMRSSFASTLRSIFLLAIPASLGLILLRRPLVSLIFQWGKFGSDSTELVAWALLWYAAGLVGHSIVEIASRAFYALHDTKTPVLVGIAAMSLNLGFSLLFTRGFESIGWMPHGGLALANSLATALEAATLLILMRKRLNGLEGKRINSAVLSSGLACLAMGAVLAGWMAFGAHLSNALIALGGVLLGGGVYGVILLILKAPEVMRVLTAIRQKLLKS